MTRLEKLCSWYSTEQKIYATDSYLSSISAIEQSLSRMSAQYLEEGITRGKYKIPRPDKQQCLHLKTLFQSPHYKIFQDILLASRVEVLRTLEYEADPVKVKFAQGRLHQLKILEMFPLENESNIQELLLDEEKQRQKTVNEDRRAQQIGRR